MDESFVNSGMRPTQCRGGKNGHRCSQTRLCCKSLCIFGKAHFGNLQSSNPHGFEEFRELESVYLDLISETKEDAPFRKLQYDAFLGEAELELSFPELPPDPTTPHAEQQPVNFLNPTPRIMPRVQTILCSTMQMRILQMFDDSPSVTWRHMQSLSKKIILFDAIFHIEMTLCLFRHLYYLSHKKKL